MANSNHDLYYAKEAAERAWSAELEKAFGKNAGDVRYTKAGEGEPGTELRAAFNAWAALMLPALLVDAVVDNAPADTVKCGDCGDMVVRLYRGPKGRRICRDCANGYL